MKKNITRKPKQGKKAAQIEAALDFFFSISKWNFLSRNRKCITAIYEKLLPMYARKIKSLADAVDLKINAFQMDDFHAICKARNIVFCESEKIPSNINLGGVKNPLGFYACDQSGKYDFIWIKAGQSAESFLHTAAHEISHFLLHRKNIMKSERKPASHLFNRLRFESGESLVAELECDLLASLLLCEKSEVIR